MRDIDKITLISFLFLTLGISKSGYSQTNTYDHFNRLTQTTYTNGAQITYLYDKLGNRIGYIMLEATIIPGCTDENAHNYNPDATEDDGSCETCNDGIQNGDETAIDCGGLKCPACGTCTTETATINDDPIPNNTTIIASDWIESAGTVEAGSQVTLQAGNYIQLLPGFHAKNGSEVHLKIADCSTPTARLITFKPAPPPVGKNSLALYPNPASGEINVVYELLSPQEVSIVLQSLNGRQLQYLLKKEQKEAGKWTLEVDGSQLPAGAYLLSLITDQERLSRKLMIIRY